jgi:hypothetical protein
MRDPMHCNRREILKADFKFPAHRRAEALVWGDGQLGGAVQRPPQFPDHRAGE